MGCGVGRGGPEGGGRGGEVGVASVARSETSHRVVKCGRRIGRDGAETSLLLQREVKCVSDMARWFRCAEIGEVRTD